MDPRRGFLGSIRLKTLKSLSRQSSLRQSSEIDKSLKSEKKNAKKTIKLLLLGNGNFDSHAKLC